MEDDGLDPLPQVIEMPQPLALYAHDLFLRADQYRQAATILADHQSAPPYSLPYPMYFTLSHALELYLKAFLVGRGVTKAETKRPGVRHSPQALFNMCRERGIQHVEFLELMSIQIEEMNSSFDFRYPTGFNLHLPTMRLCLPVLNELHEYLQPLVEAARIDGQLDWADSTLHLRGKKIRWSD